MTREEAKGLMNSVPMYQDSVEDWMIDAIIAADRKARLECAAIMRSPITSKMEDKVIKLFLQGNSINHVVFLLDYKWDADDVNGVIREELRKGRKS